MKQIFISRKDIFLFFISFSFLLSIFLTVIAGNKTNNEEDVMITAGDYVASSPAVIDIHLSNNNEKIFWDVNGYSQKGVKIVWSRQEEPTYPLRNGDKYHYFTSPNIYSDTLDSFAGEGYYYVRVCEYLGGSCGIYSNQIKVYLGPAGGLDHVIPETETEITTSTNENNIINTDTETSQATNTDIIINNNDLEDKIEQTETVQSETIQINQTKPILENNIIDNYSFELKTSFNIIEWKTNLSKELLKAYKIIYSTKTNIGYDLREGDQSLEINDLNKTNHTFVQFNSNTNYYAIVCPVFKNDTIVKCSNEVKIYFENPTTLKIEEKQDENVAPKEIVKDVVVETPKDEKNDNLASPIYPKTNDTKIIPTQSKKEPIQTEPKKNIVGKTTPLKTSISNNKEKDKNLAIVNPPKTEIKKIEIPLACKNFGILNQENCDNFLLLPEICQKYGVKDKDDCSLFVTFPNECKDNKMTSEQSCAGFLGISDVCLKEKIYNKEDCKNYNLKKNIPEICQQENAVNQEDCKKLILEKSLAPDCLAQNINSEKECNEFLKETSKEEKLNQKCQEAGIQDQKKCDIYLQQKELDQECLSLELDTKEKCNQFILNKYGLAECFEVSIYERAECENYLFNKYINKTNCEKNNQWECFNAVGNNLGKIVKQENKFRELEKIIDNKKNVKITDFADKKELTPIKSEKEISFRVVNSEKNIINQTNNFSQTSPVVLVVDSDGDGLSDEAEKRLGTDFSNPDTDNDTYLDGEEVARGYNPLGSGKLEQEISAIDKAILNNETIEQPKDKGIVNDNFTVEKIDNNLDQNIDLAYAINGKSTPNTVISLYIYSDVPMLVTVKSDQYGNWKYELEHELNDGEHEVYAVVNDETGKIKEKSLAMNFFVKEAKAVSVDDFIATINPSAHDELSESEKITSSYVFISLVLVGFAIFLFVVILDISKKSKINLKKS